MNFNEYLDVIKDSPFEEEPVGLKDFLYGKDFLNFEVLSPVQETIVEAMSNVYRYETNKDLWGKERADLIARYGKKEIIFQAGKGAGKDLISSIAMTRAIYLLLCLKEPAKYFGKPANDSIYLINVSVNAKQAKNVFFKGNLLQRVKGCSWFDGRYSHTADSISFDKNITALSGNSESESWEGYNIIMAVLDEISAFDTESASTAGVKKTADGIYDMYKQSVASRFPEDGKVVLLSFPRHKECFISKRYNEVIAERRTRLERHTFHIHKDRPVKEEGNSFTIEWEEDDIIRYKEPNVVAFKLPSWKVNPTVSLEGLMEQFMRDEKDSLKRFACMAPEAVDGYFSDRAILEYAFPEKKDSPFLPNWQLRPEVNPDPTKRYYVHVDLAHKHDRASVAVASVNKWVQQSHGGFVQVSPVIDVDLIRYWSPTPNSELQLDDVMQFIVGLKELGYDLRQVTYDFWNSLSHQQTLQRDYSINTARLSVGMEEYNTFKTALNTGRISGYYSPLLVNELLQLQNIRGKKIDHTSKSSKDVSDSVVGACYNVEKYEKYKKGNQLIEITTRVAPKKKPKVEEDTGPEVFPKMPKELKDFFSVI